MSNDLKSALKAMHYLHDPENHPKPTWKLVKEMDKVGVVKITNHTRQEFKILDPFGYRQYCDELLGKLNCHDCSNHLKFQGGWCNGKFEVCLNYHKHE